MVMTTKTIFGQRSMAHTIKWYGWVCCGILTFASAAYAAKSTMAHPTSAATAIPPTVNADKAPGHQHTLIDLSTLLAPQPGGLTAELAAERAIAVAPQVRKAAASYAHADRTASVAIAGFVPRIDLSGGYIRWSHVNLPPLTINGNTAPNPFPQILNRYDIRATVTVPVTDYFLTVLPTYRGTKHLENATRYQWQAEQAVTALRAKQAFYGFVQAQATVHIAGDAVQLLRAYVHDLQRLLQAGSATKADLLQAETQLAEAEADFARAEGGLSVAMTTLRELLDLDPATPLVVGENVFGDLVVSPPDEGQIRNQAESHRPELLAIRSLIEANRAFMHAKFGSMLPRVALSSSFNYANPNQRLVPDVQKFNGTWDAMAMLSWSPNDAVTNYVKYDEAKAELIRAQEDLRLIHDQIGIDANRSVQDLRASLFGVEAARRAVAAASEGWDVRKELFAAGEATANEMLTAETMLRRSQLGLVDAHLAARLAVAQIAHVSGLSVPSSTTPTPSQSPAQAPTSTTDPHQLPNATVTNVQP